MLRASPFRVVQAILCILRGKHSNKRNGGDLAWLFEPASKLLQAFHHRLGFPASRGPLQKWNKSELH